MDLNLAAGVGDLGRVKYLVEVMKCDPNTGPSRLTALHWACMGGHFDVARYLIEETGAQIDAKDKFQLTPLFRAISEGHIPLVKYLLEKGADLRWGDNGYTLYENALHEPVADPMRAEVMRAVRRIHIAPYLIHRRPVEWVARIVSYTN